MTKITKPLATKPETILLVANWESDVGYAWWLMENFWLQIAAAVQERNMRCLLIYPKLTELPAAIANADIEVRERDFQQFGWQNLASLTRFIKQENIRHIYLTDYPFCSPTYVFAKLAGVKNIIIHDHTPGDREPVSPFKQFVKTAIHRLPLYRADYFIGVSDFVYHRFLNVARLPKNRCFSAPNGIEPIDLSRVDKHYAQNTFHIPQDKIIVVVSGRASFYKGIDFIIRCANEMIYQRQRDNLHFLYCGDGPDMAAFQALVTKFHLNPHFTFAGKRPDMRDILPSCHIGLHAAAGEVGYSLSILEFMSAGLITLVPDLPSTSQAIEHGVNGYVYAARDLNSACHTLELAVQKIQLNQRELQENAIKTVASRYTIARTNQTFVNIMKSILFR